MTTQTVLGSRLAALGKNKAVAVLGFTIAISIAAQVALPIPGTPVPMTLTPMVVVLAGLMLGPSLGASSMILYLAIGAAGIPVFAPTGLPQGIARFFGPTGGYLIAYPAAAAVAGLVARRFPTLMGRWGASVAGIAVIFVGGISQLTILNGSLSTALALGISPFALLDVVKAFVAALIARPFVRRTAE
jgi:biotin transport system substrate-specific component